MPTGKSKNSNPPQEYDDCICASGGLINHTAQHPPSHRGYHLGMYGGGVRPAGNGLHQLNGFGIPLQHTYVHEVEVGSNNLHVLTLKCYNWHRNSKDFRSANGRIYIIECRSLSTDPMGKPLTLREVSFMHDRIVLFMHDRIVSDL